MQISVLRDIFTDKTTTSVISIDNVNQMYGLEGPVKPTGSRMAAVPQGSYEVELRWFAGYRTWLPVVMAPIEYGNLLIRAGTAADEVSTHLLLGVSRAPNALYDGPIALGQLIRAIKARIPSEPVRIVYANQVEGGGHGKQ